MKAFCIIIIIFLSTSFSAQIKFKVVEVRHNNGLGEYSMIDEKGKLIKKLDSSKYLMTFSPETYGYFAVFVKKNSLGWTAIDANENILFQVYNTTFGEPSPDYVIENKIRIIDKNEKIGFANEKGKIIIPPKFEIASHFHNGKAIIGEKCQKIPWGNHSEEGGCKHFVTKCENHGYINEKGEIMKLGKYDFEEIKKEIRWKSVEE